MEKIPITSQPGSEALPSGLKDLESLEEITVHQHLEAGDSKWIFQKIETQCYLNCHQVK